MSWATQMFILRDIAQRIFANMVNRLKWQRCGQRFDHNQYGVGILYNRTVNVGSDAIISNNR